MRIVSLVSTILMSGFIISAEAKNLPEGLGLVLFGSKYTTPSGGGATALFKAQDQDYLPHKPNEKHSGLDIRTRGVIAGLTTKIPFFSPVSGVVIATPASNKTALQFGAVIIYNAERNISYLFEHNSRIDVKIGQVIKIGDALGITGEQGAPGQAHLHIGARTGRTVSIPLNESSPQTNLLDKGVIDPLDTALGLMSFKTEWGQIIQTKLIQPFIGPVRGLEYERERAKLIYLETLKTPTAPAIQVTVLPPVITLPTITIPPVVTPPVVVTLPSAGSDIIFNAGGWNYLERTGGGVSSTQVIYPTDTTGIYNTNNGIVVQNTASRGAYQYTDWGEWVDNTTRVITVRSPRFGELRNDLVRWVTGTSPQRISDLPLNGTASFSGEFAGRVADDPVTNGTVTLGANFATSRVNVVVDTMPNAKYPFANTYVFQNMAIANGNGGYATFNGTTRIVTSGGVNYPCAVGECRIGGNFFGSVNGSPVEAAGYFGTGGLFGVWRARR